MPQKIEGAKRKEFQAFEPAYLEKIRPPLYPRNLGSEEQMLELAVKIAEQGQMQNGIVREVDGEYELVIGNRRLTSIRDIINPRYAEFLGPDGNPLPGPLPFNAIVRVLTDEQVLLMTVEENQARKNPDAVDLARNMLTMREVLGWDGARIAARFGFTVARVNQLLGLLRADEEVLTRVQAGPSVPGGLKENAARALVGLPKAEVKRLLREYDAGGVKGSVLKQRALAVKRDSSGKKSGRSVPEIKEALALVSAESQQAALLLGYIEGQPGILLKHLELREVQGDRARKLADRLMRPEGEGESPEVAAQEE